MTDEGTDKDGLPPKLKAELITAPIGLYVSHADSMTPVKVQSMLTDAMFVTKLFPVFLGTI